MDQLWICMDVGSMSTALSLGCCRRGTIYRGGLQKCHRPLPNLGLDSDPQRHGAGPRKKYDLGLLVCDLD